MMLKHTSFLKFRPELDRDDADRRWRDELGPLVLAVPGLERYVQNPGLLLSQKNWKSPAAHVLPALSTSPLAQARKRR